MELFCTASRAWDAVMILAKSAEAAKSIDGEKVRDEFEKVAGYVGAGAAEYSFSADHNGIGKNPYFMGVVKDGKLTAAK